MKKSTLKFSIAVLLLTLFSQSVNAQKCLRNIFEREGTVHSSGPANMTFLATSKKVEIKFKKTAGRANAHLNITYRNSNNVTVSERIAFDFDEANSTKSLVLQEVKDRYITMRLVNNASAARTISYDISVKGRSENLIHCENNGRSINTLGNGKLGIGDMTDHFYTVPSCTGSVNVKVRGKSGRASATIKIFEANGKYDNGNTIWTLIDNGIFSQYDGIIFDKVLTSDKMLKIQLEQTSSSAYDIFYALTVKAVKDNPTIENNKGATLKKK